MNEYEELIYSLIYNCKREISKEEMKILNQAGAIYNIYNQLTEQLGCPLEVRLQISLGTPVYIFVQLDMSRQPDISIRREDGTWQKVTEDKLLTEVIVISNEGLGDIKCPSFQVSAPEVSMPFEKFERHERRLLWKDYKKTWWLKKDKSE